MLKGSFIDKQTSSIKKVSLNALSDLFWFLKNVYFICGFSATIPL